MEPSTSAVRPKEEEQKVGSRNSSEATKKDGSSIPVRNPLSSMMSRLRPTGSKLSRSSPRAVLKDDSTAESSDQSSPLPSRVREAAVLPSALSPTEETASGSKKDRLRMRKGGTPESRMRPALKKRSPSAETSGSAASARSAKPPSPLAERLNTTEPPEDGSASSRSPARPAAVRHRDRLDVGKVCFSSQIEWMEPHEEHSETSEPPPPSTPTQPSATVSLVAAAQQPADATQQAESMRKLEAENESLRRAIENYRERERLRSPRASPLDAVAGGTDVAGEGAASRPADGSGTGLTGQKAAGGSGSERDDDPEEDEVEKAVEASPDGTFLKFDEEIGRGSFKTVYKGLDTTTGVFVAWCELQLSGNRLSKKERDRFREEADLMKGLTHPNIVRFYDYWEVDKPKRRCIVLVTELMTSGTLRTYLKNFGQKKVSLKITKSWCRQILRGLQFLHSRNPPIIHRDLKCDNIFISGTTGQVKIGDLGLATLKNRSFAKSVIGTPEFMAPEVYEEHYDEAVDVYAFGMCMLEMLTSEYPYSECTGPAQIYKKVVTGIKPFSFEKIEDQDIRQLIEWLTRLNHKDRPTVKELLTQEFFAEDCGMRVDIANREETVGSDRQVIELRLRVLDPKKRRDKHKENEAIQFNYMLNKDNPEELAKHMMMGGILGEEDVRLVAKMIGSQIQSLLRARDEKRREASAPPAAALPAVAPAASAGAGTSALPQQQPAAGTPQVAASAPGASVAPTAAQLPGSVQQLPVASSAVQVSASQPPDLVSPQAETAPSMAAAVAAAPPTAAGSTAATSGVTAAPGPTDPASAPAVGPPSTGTAPAPAESSVAETESDTTIGGEKKEKKKPTKRRRTCEPLPRLTVLEVKVSSNGPVVSCLLETNQSQAITFKFDLREADVSAISHKMMEAHLLPRDDAQFFGDQLRAVIQHQIAAAESNGSNGHGAAISSTPAAQQDDGGVGGGVVAAQPDSTLVVCSADDRVLELSSTTSITLDYCSQQQHGSPSKAVGRPSRFIVSSVTQTGPVSSSASSPQSVNTEEPIGVSSPSAVSAAGAVHSLVEAAVSTAAAPSADSSTSLEPAGSVAVVAAACLEPSGQSPLSTSPESAAAPGQQLPARTATSDTVAAVVSLADHVNGPSAPPSQLPVVSSAAGGNRSDLAPSVSGAAVTDSSPQEPLAAAESSACVSSSQQLPLQVNGAGDLQETAAAVQLATGTQTVSAMRGGPISHPSLVNGAEQLQPPGVDEAAVVAAGAGGGQAGASPELTLSPQNTEHGGMYKLEDLRKQLNRLTCQSGEGAPCSSGPPSQSPTPVPAVCSSPDMLEVHQRLASISSGLDSVQSTTAVASTTVSSTAASRADSVEQLASVPCQLLLPDPPAAALLPTAITPQQLSGADASRSVSSTESAASDRKKAPPLLLADLEKELSKLHGKSAATSQLSSSSATAVGKDEPTAGPSSSSLSTADETPAGPGSDAPTADVDVSATSSSAGESRPSTVVLPSVGARGSASVRRGRFSITASRTPMSAAAAAAVPSAGSTTTVGQPPFPPVVAAARPVSPRSAALPDPASCGLELSAALTLEYSEFVETHPQFVELVARHRSQTLSLMRQQEQERVQLRLVLSELWSSRREQQQAPTQQLQQAPAQQLQQEPTQQLQPAPAQQLQQAPVQHLQQTPAQQLQQSPAQQLQQTPNPSCS